jgi:hypothetical protein
MTMLTGGCMCGQVRYEASGTPFHPTICHCADCRRAVGAHVVAWFSVPRASLRWTGTPPASFKSSAPVVRRFCAACGTSLTFEDDAHPDELDLTIASLDDPARVAPIDHVWAASRPGWDMICDGLPAYGRTRREG